MLMAYEKGADLIVSVGAHFNLIEFLDRKRGGMSSTFLTRLRIGEKLVDAKGVSRLYSPASTIGPLVLFLAVFTVLLVIVIATSPALSDLAELLWLKIRIWLGHRRPSGRNLAFRLMGYSARYHAVSLVAVFIALAIGILIGAEFGGDTLSSTRRNLEREPRRQPAGRPRPLRRSWAANWAAPTSSPNASIRSWSATSSTGGGSGCSRSATCRGTSPTRSRKRSGRPGRAWSASASSASRSTCTALAGDLSKTRFADIAENPDTQSAFGVGIGRQVVRGGTLVEKVRGHLFSRASGNFGALDGVIVVRIQPEEMGPKRTAVAGQLESGLMSGIVATQAPAVGVETSDSDDSSISFFQGNDLSSVDDVDLVAGRLATVFALLGAEGSFGVKGGADRLLPDLIVPPAGTGVAPAAPAPK